jgi:hypothetical protein
MRFTPSLAVLFMIFMSSFPKKFVSGPQMSDVDDEQKECRESWVWSLLLLKNFHENLVRPSSVKGWNFFKKCLHPLQKFKVILKFSLMNFNSACATLGTHPLTFKCLSYPLQLFTVYSN